MLGPWVGHFLIKLITSFSFWVNYTVLNDMFICMVTYTPSITYSAWYLVNSTERVSWCNHHWQAVNIFSQYSRWLDMSVQKQVACKDCKDVCSHFGLCRYIATATHQINTANEKVVCSLWRNAWVLLLLIETPQTTPVTHQTWVSCKEYIVERTTEKKRWTHCH